MSRIILIAVFLPSCLPVQRDARPVWRDFRGVIHVHSFHSHDSKGSYEEILAACKKQGIDFVCMTDHPPDGDHGRPLREGWRGVHDGVLFIQGAEYSDQILALGIREPISGVSRQERIDAIHAQGGLAFVCHPEEIRAWDFERFDGMEIWNTHAALKELMRNPTRLAEALKLARTDLEGAWRLLLKRPDTILTAWDELNRQRRVVGIAGNDAHHNTQVLGLDLDPYEVSFRFVTTHVLAEKLTEASILEALKEGRVYVAFECLGPASHELLAGPLRVGEERTYVPIGALGLNRVEVTQNGLPWIFGNP